jgi:hypothetical protein
VLAVVRAQTRRVLARRGADIVLVQRWVSLRSNRRI